MHPNAQPLLGISVGPGLMLVEVGELYPRFAALGWSRPFFLQFLKCLRLRPLLGPKSTVYYLKEALDLALTAYLHPDHPDSPHLSSRFLKKHHEAIILSLMAYRTMNHESKPVDRAALSQALGHLADSIERYGEPNANELDMEVERVVKNRADFKDPKRSSPPHEVKESTPAYTDVNVGGGFQIPIFLDRPRKRPRAQPLPAEGCGGAPLPDAPPLIQ